jgi:hypothetical protein
MIGLCIYTYIYIIFISEILIYGEYENTDTRISRLVSEKFAACVKKGSQKLAMKSE